MIEHTRLLVWEDGTDWDGMALDADASNNEEIIQAWLDDVGDDADAAKLCACDSWVAVEWDEERGCYYREGIVDCRDSIRQYERAYEPDDINCLSDIYG